jgi:hypothetical protein
VFFNVALHAVIKYSGNKVIIVSSTYVSYSAEVPASGQVGGAERRAGR